MSYHHKSGAQKRREKAMRAEGVKGQTTRICRVGYRIFQKGDLRPAIRNAGGGGVRFRSDTMGGDRCQNSRPLFNDWGGGGGVVKCCGLLHKTITYQPLFHTIGYYYS